MRADGRRPDELRPVDFVPGFLAYAEGSVLVSFGQTRVVCAVSVDETVPAFLRGKGRGWLTAEYRMLPRATNTRSAREGATVPVSGRTHEIQRLIGRSLRMSVDLTALGERTLTLDCDVLQADGGTRTAAITGGYVAVALALRRLVANGKLASSPLAQQIAAVSVGIVDGVPLLDLPYAEDSRAEVDSNVVMTGAGDLIELQSTAEHAAFSRRQLSDLLDLADIGIQRLFVAQDAALAQAH